jgi:hypothetical protein
MRTKIDILKRTVYQIDHLRRISRAIARIDTAECNSALPARSSARRDTLLKDAQDIAASMGFCAFHQSDPRGCSLYLIDKSMGRDDYTTGLALY